MAECGVYTGATSQLITLACKEQNYKGRFHLFDTFSGMPETSVPERDYHSPGDFGDTSLEAVKARLRDAEDFCEYHVGFMPETFSEVEKVRLYSFVHVDVDIYPSVLTCCEWFYPRLVSGGVLIFDDYGFYPYRYAARKAADEYFADKREKPIALPTGQAIVIKI